MLEVTLRTAVDTAKHLFTLDEGPMFPYPSLSPPTSMLATQTPVSLLRGIWKVPWNCPTEVLYVAVMSCSVKPSASIILMIAEPVLAWAVLGKVGEKRKVSV